MKVLGTAIFLWVISAILAISFGSVGDASWDVIVQTRLPRVLLGSAIGMALSTAGVLLQTLFQNPLCEPFTLGISSGSAFGAVLALSLGVLVGGDVFSSNHLVVLGALGGGILISAFLVGVGALRGAGTLSILLVGVMLNLFCSSGLSVWMALSDPMGVQSAVFWLMGDLSRATFASGMTALVGVSALLLTVFSQSRSLDGLLLGEDHALSLGVSVRSARRNIILLASALVALSVGYSGMIGFVGLMVPHFCRKFVGSLHIKLLPVTAVTGAWVVVFADIFSRTLRPPYEIPTGVVTALLGAPLFISALLRERRLG